ncbi:Vms1/Ankzf1 family peptidyl-tRNA hydrolase [Sphaerimonospora cavernae]|uniref:Vms1/Ankzf1 family peptidyl-tRNA hydrolase n=1 Tax=Sphaerimonospora cavernae TaxID=1740611 RepID=A0ABV6UAU2_9ACTN
MRLDFIRPLYDRPGPYASVYLDTERSEQGQADVVQRRWAMLRERLTEAGAPTDVLDPIGGLVLDPRVVAPGRAVFAAGGEVVFAHPLHVQPRRQTARWSPLPHVVPLLAQRGEPVPHLEVLADHAGADLVIARNGARRELTVESTTDYPMQKTGKGGWSQTRYDRDAEETWRRNAVAVAEVVDREVHDSGAEIVVLAGDPKSRGLVMERLSKDTARKVTVAEHGSRAAGADRRNFEADVDRACEAWAERCRAELLDAYATGPYATGLQETARALRDARVRTLLLHDDPSSTATVWVGPEPTHLSTDRADLLDWGVAEPFEERADSALARAVAGTDADLWFVDHLPSPDGVGAVLRF